MKITVIKKQSKIQHINKGFGYDNFFDIGCSLNLNKSMFDNVDKEQEHCEDAKNEEYSNGHSTILTIARYPLCNYDNVITIDEHCRTKLGSGTKQDEAGILLIQYFLYYMDCTTYCL